VNELFLFQILERVGYVSDEGKSQAAVEIRSLSRENSCIEQEKLTPEAS
jgi:hypothetical protein